MRCGFGRGHLHSFTFPCIFRSFAFSSFFSAYGPLAGPLTTHAWPKTRPLVHALPTRSITYLPALSFAVHPSTQSLTHSLIVPFPQFTLLHHNSLDFTSRALNRLTIYDSRQSLPLRPFLHTLTFTLRRRYANPRPTHRLPPQPRPPARQTHRRNRHSLHIPGTR